MKKIVAIALCLTVAPAFGATCKISEYGEIVKDASAVVVPVASEPAITTQTVTYTTSTQSAKFNARTRFVRIVCDAKAHFVFGTDPTADADDPYLSQDTPEYFGIGYQTSGTEDFEVAFYDGSS